MNNGPNGVYLNTLTVQEALENFCPFFSHEFAVTYLRNDISLSTRAIKEQWCHNQITLKASPTTSPDLLKEQQFLYPHMMKSTNS